MSVEDLIGRPGVVYQPKDIEKGLPLDETTRELKDFLKHFKTLDHYYMTMDEKLDPNLNSKELLARCKDYFLKLIFLDTTIKKQKKEKKINTDSRLNFLNSASQQDTDEQEEKRFLLELGFSEKYL